MFRTGTIADIDWSAVDCTKSIEPDCWSLQIEAQDRIKELGYNPFLMRAVETELEAQSAPRNQWMIPVGAAATIAGGVMMAKMADDSPGGMAAVAGLVLLGVGLISRFAGKA